MSLLESRAHKVLAVALQHVAWELQQQAATHLLVRASPSHHLLLCVVSLQTYEEAARQAALSRIYGGIHIAIDNDDGYRLGERIGQNVAATLARLSPERYRSKSGSLLLRHMPCTVKHLTCCARRHQRCSLCLPDQCHSQCLASTASSSALELTPQAQQLN